MTVDRLLKSGGMTLGALLLAVTSSGCLMNPGYAYLTPPGFSSTAHRVKMQQASEKMLTSQQSPGSPHHQHHEEKISSQEGGVQASSEGGHWWSRWPKSPVTVGPPVTTKPENGSSEKTKLAGESERPAS